MPILLRILVAGLTFLLVNASILLADSPSWDTFSDTWVATDRQGREVPTVQQTGETKPHKIVAMFYFLWTDAPGAAVWDNSKILAADPLHPVFGPKYAQHWWSEPWFGYYLNSDESVVRKHMQMLADAGVDVIVFDNTNGPTYPRAREVVCRVLSDMKAKGERCPQIACFAGHGAWDKVYRDFYEKHQHEDLWFKWEGKPLLLVHVEPGEKISEKLNDRLRNFFTIRDSWAWAVPGKDWFADGHDKWAWLDNYPQHFGWHDSPEIPEEVSVAVAQHATSSIGRSFHDGKEPPSDKFDSGRGLYFAEQTRQALKIDPQVVFITQWNEWTAQRFISGGAGTFANHPMAAGDSIFIDEYSPEFSRDIEPVRGGFEDDYYYQMIGFIRQFKGVRPIQPVILQPIHIDGTFADWTKVEPEYRDDIGDPVHRNSPGWGHEKYVNDTGRNDLIAAKVSYDRENVYFYVRTKDPITPYTDPNWMLLFINVHGEEKKGVEKQARWLSYNFIVNRAAIADRSTTLEENLNGTYRWGNAKPVEFATAGNELELRIPRADLGIGKLPAVIDFKWADNIQQTGDASDFTLNGDAAPNDRFNYRAILTPIPNR